MKTLREVVIGALAAMLVWLTAAASEVPGHIAPAAGSPLFVAGFDVEQVPQLPVGTPLVFTLFGTPGASATLRIDGVERRLRLQEVQAGVYEGTYVIAADDRITATSRVTADLWLANQVATMALEEPLLLGASAVRPCDDCGVVQAVQAIDVNRPPGATGAIAGSLIGAIVGSQFGSGDGRKAAGILGALGGAIVGREIERNYAKRTHHELVVRLDNGATRTRRYDTRPPLQVGDRVRLHNGTWQRESSVVPY